MAPLIPPATPINTTLTHYANTSLTGMAAFITSKQIEAQLLDLPHNNGSTKQPENITKYRVSLFKRAKESATKFLGRCFFDNNNLTTVLPPFSHEPITFREEQYKAGTVKIVWIVYHIM